MRDPSAAEAAGRRGCTTPPALLRGSCDVQLQPWQISESSCMRGFKNCAASSPVCLFRIQKQTFLEPLPQYNDSQRPLGRRYRQSRSSPSRGTHGSRRIDVSSASSHRYRHISSRDFHRLFSLPREASDDGIFVYLPPLPKIDTLRFPRTLKVGRRCFRRLVVLRVMRMRVLRLQLPSSRPLTRWEAFAKAKGIEKRKRSRLVWSEEVKDWVPRWGPRGLKAIQRQAQDPFKKEKQQRELQKAKQKLREVRNAAEAQAGRGAARAVLKGGSGSARLPPGVPLLSSTQKKHRNKSKEELKELLHR
ncbi:ribosome biogenesis regulatory [Cyclospora cayetanensis]|uniref:Ribosome biogenesis regulatory protein n=1 Tax=Cyclospora cayetanensis TaxID=88456 RepID=A0A1D3D496_9EIME|nr:ribosome biogenesis regulatory [Cyclospora cayetanensis]